MFNKMKFKDKIKFFLKKAWFSNKSLTINNIDTLKKKKIKNKIIFFYKK